MAASSSSGLRFSTGVSRVELTTMYEEFNIAIKAFCIIVSRVFPKISHDKLFSGYVSTRESRINTELFMFPVFAKKLFKGIQLTVKTELVQSNHPLYIMFDPSHGSNLIALAKSFWTGYEHAYNEFKGTMHNMQPYHLAFIKLVAAIIIMDKLPELPADISPEHISLALNIGQFRIPHVHLHVADIIASACRVVEPCVYLRMLTAPHQRSAPVDPHDKITVEILEMRHRFPINSFDSNGVFIEQKKIAGQGAYSTAFYACGSEVAACDTIVKISMNNDNETIVAKEALKKGFGPKYVSKVFTLPPSFIAYPMFRLTCTLYDAMSQGKFYPTDAISLYNLISRFETANFVHHDLKADNIMLWVDHKNRRRWYIIDYGTAWFGGTSYNTSSEPSIADLANIPYGWNFNLGRLSKSKTHYKGWPRIIFRSPPERFDACCLLAHLSIYSEEEVSSYVLRLIIDTFKPYVSSHLIMTSTNMIQYRKVLDPPSEPKNLLYKAKHNKRPGYFEYFRVPNADAPSVQGPPSTGLQDPTAATASSSGTT